MRGLCSCPWSTVSSSSWARMTMGPGVVLRALQRVASRRRPHRRCGILESHDAHFVVVDLGLELRHMAAVIAAVRPAGSDCEGIRSAASASPSAVLLEEERHLLMLIHKPLDMAAMAPLSRAGLSKP